MSPPPSRLPSPDVSIKKLNNCLKGEMCHLFAKDCQAPLESRANVGGIGAGGRCWGGAGTLGANVNGGRRECSLHLAGSDHTMRNTVGPQKMRTHK